MRSLVLYEVMFTCLLSNLFQFSPEDIISDGIYVANGAIAK